MNTNFIEVGLAIYKTFGRGAAKRALTPPRSYVEAVCKKSGAAVEKAINERDESVEEMLEFLESLIDVNFVDPDPKK